VLGLPPEGNIGRIIGDPRATGWSTTDELLAGVIELLDVGNRLYFRAHTKRGTQQPKPIKVPRPESSAGETDAVTPRKRQATSAELRQFFGGSARYTGPPLEELASSSGNPVTGPAAGEVG
jgi:hypothetical protein